MGGKRQRGDLNPCGQSPMDFESISLTARTHCLGESLKESLELMSTSRWTHLRRGPEAARVRGYWGESDSEGIRTPAGRARWISSPSPWPLGHTVSGVLGKETEAWWLLVRKNNVAAGQTLVKSTGRSCVAWGHRRRGHHPSTDTRCLCRETCSEALALQRCLV